MYDTSGELLQRWKSPKKSSLTLTLKCACAETFDVVEHENPHSSLITRKETEKRDTFLHFDTGNEV